MTTQRDEHGGHPAVLPQAYGYDATGKWVRLSSADRTHWRYWRGERVVNELRVDDAHADPVQVTWVGAAGSALAEQVAGSEQRTTLLAVAPGGSVLLEADTAVRVLAYAPHGHRDPSSALATPGFNGEGLDAGSGCYLLGPGHHRPYSPALGLFLAADNASPFRAGGLNSLAYCAGDPVNLSDPSGHFWKWIVAGIGIVAGVVAVAASFGAASGAVGALAAGGIAALTKSGAAAITATTLGALAVGAEVGAIAAGAAGDDGTATVLGWVGFGLGMAGVASAAAKTAVRGAARFSRFAQRATSSRSGAMPMRGAAAGSRRATQAALPPAARTPTPSPRPTPPGSPSWGAPSMLPELSPTAARRAAARNMFGRRRVVRRVSEDDLVSSDSDFGIADDLAGAEPQSAWDWTPPPLKEYPSVPYTTGQYQVGSQSANLPVDVNGHIQFLGDSAVSGPVGRWHYAMRRIVARRAAWRDPAPGYDRSTLPSYASLGFPG